MRTVTCQNPGCENNGHPIEIPDAPPEGDVVVCGPCGTVLEVTAAGAEVKVGDSSAGA